MKNSLEIKILFYKSSIRASVWSKNKGEPGPRAPSLIHHFFPDKLGGFRTLDR